MAAELAEISRSPQHELVDMALGHPEGNNDDEDDDRSKTWRWPHERELLAQLWRMRTSLGDVFKLSKKKLHVSQEYQR